MLHLRTRSYYPSRKEIIYICSALLTFGVALAQPAFTGEASSDFLLSGAICLQDSSGKDVGLSAAFPQGSTSGWDVKAICFYYDMPADVMYVGVDFYGIAGDADGDGDPGRTSTILENLSAVDEPDLKGTEALVLLLDTDLDGKYDLAVGVNGTTDLSGFGTYHFVGRKNTPAFGFGQRLSPDPATLYASPDASKPDLEFTISQFSELPGISFTQGGSLSFGFEFFAGSFSDGGIGEDLLPGPEGIVVTIPTEITSGGSP